MKAVIDCQSLPGQVLKHRAVWYKEGNHKSRLRSEQDYVLGGGKIRRKREEIAWWEKRRTKATGDCCFSLLPSWWGKIHKRIMSTYIIKYKWFFDPTLLVFCLPIKASLSCVMQLSFNSCTLFYIVRPLSFPQSHTAFLSGVAYRLVTSRDIFKMDGWMKVWVHSPWF